MQSVLRDAHLCPEDTRLCAHLGKDYEDVLCR
jgi:hypothetical protein